jgi:predicted HD phosphohydrolase
MTRISATSFEAATAEDWEAAIAYGRRHYLADAGVAVLKLLESQKDDEAHGWGVNNYQHSLQCATKALRNGEDEDYIVATLLHDVGQELDPFRHDRIAGTMLKPFLSPGSHWMVANHQVFQLSFRTNSPFDLKACERFRGHPYFERTMRFCDLYDQSCFDPNYDWLPMTTFEPMVRRVFGRVMEERLAAGYPRASA